MTIAVDTNVIVRYLTLDDPAQAQAATDLLESGVQIQISTVVLCEVAWVLSRGYRHTATEIAAAIRTLTSPRLVAVQDQEILAAGLAMLDAGGDFADGCILQEARRARAETLVTFDRPLARRGGSAVRLLASA
jgi:predicted nucleic-acid-binding protein